MFVLGCINSLFSANVEGVEELAGCRMAAAAAAATKQIANYQLKRWRRSHRNSTVLEALIAPNAKECYLYLSPTPLTQHRDINQVGF